MFRKNFISLAFILALSSLAANAKCPTSHSQDCADGFCCQQGYSCCGNGSCCQPGYPIYCKTNNKCYQNQADAQEESCTDLTTCGLPKDKPSEKKE